jgi:hypothetical protein
MTSSPYIEMSDLEETFPYTIIRTTNLIYTEIQTEGGKQFAAVSMDDDKEDD